MTRWAIRGRRRSRKGCGGTSPVIRIGVLEVVVVVAAVAADGERVGERLPRTAGAADSLLVVEPLRRHVAHQDGLQRSDVDADLHRGGDAEHVEFARDVVFRRLGQQDALEPALPPALLVQRLGLAG